jgi:hypothetical protein
LALLAASGAAGVGVSESDLLNAIVILQPFAAMPT